jgi:hypothetical protein
MQKSVEDQDPAIREDVVRELEQYSVRVLQAVVQILEMQEARRQKQ